MTREVFDEIICRVCKINKEELSDELKLKEDLYLTSIKAMVLFSELETKENKELDYTQLQSVRTVSELWKLMNNGENE